MKLLIDSISFSDYRGLEQRITDAKRYRRVDVRPVKSFPDFGDSKEESESSLVVGEFKLVLVPVGFLDFHRMALKMSFLTFLIYKVRPAKF